MRIGTLQTMLANRAVDANCLVLVRVQGFLGSACKRHEESSRTDATVSKHSLFLAIIMPRKLEVRVIQIWLILKRVYPQ